MPEVSSDPDNIFAIMEIHISIQDYMDAWPRQKHSQVETYYVKLANRLYESVLPLRSAMLVTDDLKTLACKLTCYFEDIVADMGIWRSFSALCQQRYGMPVPFFHTDEEYYPDEPSLDAVRFLVWNTVSGCYIDDWLPVHDRELLGLAQVVYELLDSEFELAPVNDACKQAVAGAVERAAEDFKEFCACLVWVLDSNYLTGDHWLADSVYANTNVYFEKSDSLSFDSVVDWATEKYLYIFKSGPLALTGAQWLSALAGTLGMTKERDLFNNIEVVKVDNYRLQFVDDEWVHLDNLRGREFDIKTDVILSVHNDVRECNACIAQLVRHAGQWNTGKLFIPCDMTDEQILNENSKYRGNKVSSRVVGQKLAADRMLAATGARRVLYFGSVQQADVELKRMGLLKVHDVLQGSDADAQAPCCAWIDVTGDTARLCFVPEIASAIADPANPYYKAKHTPDVVEQLLTNQQVPTAMLDWLIDHDFLPDVVRAEMLDQGSAGQPLRSDMHLLVRALRRNGL